MKKNITKIDNKTVEDKEKNEEDGPDQNNDSSQSSSRFNSSTCDVCGEDYFYYPCVKRGYIKWEKILLLSRYILNSKFC